TSANVDDATLAAKALADLGDKLRQIDPPVVRRVADALQRIIDTTANNASATGLRAAAVTALGSLRDPRSSNLFISLLRPNVDGPVRRAAVGGLGKLGDPNAAEAIALLPLIDPDPTIRLETATSLNGISGFA